MDSWHSFHNEESTALNANDGCFKQPLTKKQNLGRAVNRTVSMLACRQSRWTVSYFKLI